MCLLEARALPPGRYVVQAATFEPRQEGKFALALNSSAAASLRAAPPEGHGLTRLVLKGEWGAADGTAAGCPNHSNWHRNPQVRLVLSARSAVLMRLRCPARAGGLERCRPSLGLDLFRRDGADGGRLGCAEITPRSRFTSSLGDFYTWRRALFPPGPRRAVRRRRSARAAACTRTPLAACSCRGARWARASTPRSRFTLCLGEVCI